MFKAVTTTAIDIKKDSNISHIGTYVGKSDLKTKLGDQVVWNFVDEDGLPFSIYGFTLLNRAMSTIPLNVLCRITYRGMLFVKTKYKPDGQDVHQVLVEVDTGDEAPPATPEALLPEPVADTVPF